MLGRTVQTVKQGRRWGGGWGRRPPGRAGAERSLHLRRYRKFTEMRVMESFIAYSQGSSSFDKIILVPELPLALSVRALPFVTSSQLPFWSVTRPCCFFHSSAFSLFFLLRSNLHTTARLLFLKYHLDCVTSQLKNLSALSIVTDQVWTQVLVGRPQL